jgi:hypothetical protein
MQEGRKIKIDNDQNDLSTFGLPKEYLLKLFSGSDRSKDKDEQDNRQAIMQQFMKQLENNSSRADIISWYPQPYFKLPN